VADDLKRVLREVEATPGWTITRRRNHNIILGPEGQQVVSCATRAGGRAHKNLIGQLRRAGLDLRPRTQQQPKAKRRATA
jgi:hypothetical protein